MRKTGAGSGWRWLRCGLHRAWRGPRAIYGAALMILLANVFGAGAQIATSGIVGAQAGELAGLLVGLVFGVCVYPPLFGGLFRILDAVEHGRPAFAGQVFAAFRRGGGAPALIGVQLVVTLVYGLAIGAALLASGSGSEIIAWYLEIVALDPARAEALPAAPAAILWVAGVWLLLAPALIGFAAIAYGQVAVAGRSVRAAVGDGLRGALGALPALFVFVLGLLLLWAGVVLATGAFGALLAFVPGPLLLLVVFALMLFVLVVGFFFMVVLLAAMYALWRDIAGPAAAMDVEPPDTDATIVA